MTTKFHPRPWRSTAERKRFKASLSAEERASITIWRERHEEYEFADDTIQPHEIPRSGSFCNWMRSHSESIAMK